MLGVIRVSLGVIRVSLPVALLCAPPRGPESLRGVSCPPDVCGRRLFWGVSLRSWWFWQWKLDANVWTAPSVAIGPPDRPALPRMILTHEGFMEL